MQPATKPRILAIAPGARYLGLALLEGEELLRFGVKPFPGRKTVGILLKKAKHHLEELISRHQPQTLVIEEPFYAPARLSPLLMALTHALKCWGRKKGLRVISYRPTTVKERLCVGKRTRKSLGEAVLRRYPQLYFYRKPTRTWHYWQQMLDAVALGVVAFMDAEKRPESKRSIRSH